MKAAKELAQKPDTNELKTFVESHAHPALWYTQS